MSPPTDNNPPAVEFVPIAQNTLGWLDHRLGLATASAFDRIITPAKLQPSKSADKYAAELIAEWWLGKPLDAESTAFMERGTELEAEAVAAYEMVTGHTTEPGGFFRCSDLLVGCSPDRLVPETTREGLDRLGLLEIKTPSAAVHVGYVINPDRLLREYFIQVLGQLWVTGAEWCDLVSYSPVFDHVLIHVRRDEYLDQIASVASSVVGFDIALKSLRARWQERYPDQSPTVPMSLRDHEEVIL